MKYCKQFITLFIITLMLMVTSPSSAQTGVSVGDLYVKGKIVDNYLNLEYSFSVENKLDKAQEFSFYVPTINNIYLSNVSIELTNSTLWGRVFPVQKSQEIYNQTVEQNLTGALISDLGNRYYVKFNLAALETAHIRFQLEGALTRTLGEYQVEFLPANLFTGNVHVDISVVSNRAPLTGIKLPDLPSALFTSITNGFQVTYSGSVPFDGITLTYGTTRYEGDASIIGYSNGTENFFAYNLAPELNDTSSMPRQFVFVIDRSGSMTGLPMDYVKQAFANVISSMNDQDKFNVIAFSSIATSMWSETRNATSDNKETAKNWVDAISASGSTNIYDSVIQALDSFGSKAGFINGILLLSDGQPNAGAYTTKDDIVNNLKANNVDEIPISTIAFGDNADESLMSEIAASSGGVYIKIGANENSASEILRFFNDVSGTEVMGWSLSVSSATTLNNVESFGSLSNGNEIVVTGTFNTEVKVSAEIRYPDKNSTNTRVMNTDLVKSEFNHVEKLWAIQRISYLKGQGLDEQLTELAMYYGLVVKGYTSMVLSELLDQPDQEARDTNVANSRTFATTTTFATATDMAGATGSPITNKYTSNSEAVNFIGVLSSVAVIAVIAIRRKFSLKFRT